MKKDSRRKYRISSLEGNIEIHNSLPNELSNTTLSYNEYKNILFQIKEIQSHNIMVTSALVVVPGLILSIIIFYSVNFRVSNLIWVFIGVLSTIYVFCSIYIVYLYYSKMDRFLEKLNIANSKHQIYISSELEYNESSEIHYRVFYIYYWRSKEISYEYAQPFASEQIASCDKAPLLDNNDYSISFPGYIINNVNDNNDNSNLNSINSEGESAVNIQLKIINI